MKKSLMENFIFCAVALNIFFLLKQNIIVLVAYKPVAYKKGVL